MRVGAAAAWACAVCAARAACVCVCVCVRAARSVVVRTSLMQSSIVKRVTHIISTHAHAFSVM